MDSIVGGFDVFLSHAIEDKIAIANELNDRLVSAGIKVRFTGSELRYGDDLGKTLKEGLSKARVGIVLLTKNYLSKMANRQQLYAIINANNHNYQRLLTIHYGSAGIDSGSEDVRWDSVSLNPYDELDNIVRVILEKINNVPVDMTG